MNGALATCLEIGVRNGYELGYEDGRWIGVFAGITIAVLSALAVDMVMNLYKKWKAK